MQVRDDKRQYLSRFGSIAWTEHESQYSQAKLELYGLFRALCAYRIYIIRVKNLVIEVDTKYLKGMLNNPDIQPNATINRWIAGILLFDFKLVQCPRFITLLLMVCPADSQLQRTCQRWMTLRNG
jgi:hypothetical protein